MKQPNLSKKSVQQGLGVMEQDELKNVIGYEFLEDEEEELSPAEMKTQLKELKKQQLINIDDLPDFVDRELEIDTLSELAAEQFDKIVLKAFNAEDRHAADLLNAANAMLKTALDAKKSIIDTRMKLRELELKENKASGNGNGTSNQKPKDIEGGVVSSRNNLLKSKTNK